MVFGQEPRARRVHTIRGTRLKFISLPSATIQYTSSTQEADISLLVFLAQRVMMHMLTIHLFANQSHSNLQRYIALLNRHKRDNDQIITSASTNPVVNCRFSATPIIYSLISLWLMKINLFILFCLHLSLCNYLPFRPGTRETHGSLLCF